MVRKKHDWEKRIVKTASFRTTPFSFSIDIEIDHHSKLLGIHDTSDFNHFLLKNSGLNFNEFNNKIKEFVLKLANIKDRELSKEYRKYRAEKILELHNKEDIKKRMNNYLKNGEYK